MSARRRGLAEAADAGGDVDEATAEVATGSNVAPFFGTLRAVLLLSDELDAQARGKATFATWAGTAAGTAIVVATATAVGLAVKADCNPDASTFGCAIAG